MIGPDNHQTKQDGCTRVLVIGPSMDIVGGQSVQLERLLAALRSSERVNAAFLPINPRLPGVLSYLQQFKYVRTVVTSAAYFTQLVRNVYKYDVVHVFSASYWSYLIAPLPALMVGRLFKKHTLLNYHSGEAEDHLANWRTAVSTIKRFATRIAVPSGYLVEVFRSFGLEATAVPNFVNIDQFIYSRRESLAPRFFSNRNHEAHYDIECTLKAFHLIQQAVPDATLIVAGDGPLRLQLEQTAVGLNLNARFVGRVSQTEMAKLYNNADFYLNTPRIDNMPLSVLEAFASGLPVISTDAGGIPWIVRDRENGLVVPAGDYRAVADAAMALLGDNSFALKLADAARAECLARYTWPVVREEWENLYSELAASTTK